MFTRVSESLAVQFLLVGEAHLPLQPRFNTKLDTRSEPAMVAKDLLTAQGIFVLFIVNCEMSNVFSRHNLQVQCIFITMIWLVKNT